MKKKILTVSGDPGGARTLLPVIQKMQASFILEFSHFAYIAAREVFQQAGVKVHAQNHDLQQAHVESYLSESAPDVLLTATSMHEFAFEKKFILAARKLGIPSISVIDFWANYSMRFDDPNGELSYLPDKIAIMDSNAKQEMVSEGFPEDILEITGQPAFDELKKNSRKYDEELISRYRRNLDITEDEKLILYYSQPIKKYFAGTSAYPGFDEYSVLQEIIDILERVSSQIKKQTRLCVLPHPTQSKADFEKYSNSRVDVLQPGQSSDLLLLAADLVLGMTSSRLFEAAVLGCPVLSLQPGNGPIFSYPQTDDVHIPVIQDNEQIVSGILQELQNPSPIFNRTDKDTGCANPAALRIAELIFVMIKESKNDFALCGKGSSL